MSKKKDQDLASKPSNYVLYSDGGSNPSRNYAAGYGIHGYAHTRALSKKGSGAKFTPSNDGYLRSRDATLEVELKHYVDIWGSLGQGVTNNVAELTALIESLKWIESRIDEGEQIESVLIYTDSSYCVQGINEWVDTWIKNNWLKSDGQKVSNKEYWVDLKQRIDQLSKKITLRIEWIRGHDGDLGNYLADQFATRGLTVSEKGYEEHQVIVSEPTGYWSSKVDYNRLFGKGHWYFSTNTDKGYSHDGRRIYFIGDHAEEDVMLGKRISDASYAVILTKKDEPVLDAIENEQNALLEDDTKRFVIARLNNILQARYYNEFEQYGGRYLRRANRRGDLITADNKPITQVKDPARLGFRAAEHLNALRMIIEYALDENTRPFKMIFTDLTERLYRVEQTKKTEKVKLADDIDNTTRKLNFDIGYNTGAKEGSVSLGLCLGLDLPSRNVLSALAPRKPSVYVVTWRESDQAFRFATLIHAGDDSAIYAAIYSNIYLLNKKKRQT